MLSWSFFKKIGIFRSQNNETSIPTKTHKVKDDLEDTFIRDPRGKLDAFVGEEDSENSFVIAPIPRKDVQVKISTGINSTCDDIVGQLDNLGINTTQPVASDNSWLTAGQWDHHNALSSDEEMFQDCDGFDTASGATSPQIVDNGNQTNDFNSATIDNTRFFPSNVANSTFAQTIGMDNDFNSLNNYMSLGTMDEYIQVGNLNDTVFQSLDPVISNDTAENGFNKSLDNSAQEVKNDTTISIKSDEASQEQLEEPALTESEKQMDNIGTGGADASPVDDLNCTTEIKSTEVISLSDIALKVLDTNQAVEKIEPIFIKKEAPSNSIEAEITDPVPTTEIVVKEEPNITDDNHFPETICQSMDSTVIVASNDVNRHLPNETIVMSKCESEVETPSTATSFSIESNIDNQEIPIKHAVVPPPVPNDIANETIVVTVDTSSDKNSSEPIEIGQNITNDITFDTQLKSVCEQPLTNSIPNFVTPTVDQISSHSKPVDANSCNDFIPISTSNALPLTQTPRALPAATGKSSSCNMNSTFDVTTKFISAERSSVRKTETPGIISDSAVQQSRPQSFNQTVVIDTKIVDTPNTDATDTSKTIPSLPPQPSQPQNPQPLPFEAGGNSFGLTDDDFATSGIILNPSDFDYLLSRGDSSGSLNSRNSILERFDPLSRQSILPVPVSSTANAVQKRFAIIEENETLNGDQTLISAGDSIHVPKSTDNIKLDSQSSSLENCSDSHTTSSSSETYATAPIEPSPTNITMNADLIHEMNNDNMKTLEIVSKEHEKPSFKMSEEKMGKNDVAEELEKKLKEAELREEALIRRITEKDKAMNKMSAVMENYEKTMVEMITEREQLTQNFEKQITQLKAERDSNQHHLTSLETTFSDLHIKYEKSKQLALEVKESESKLLEKLEFAQQQIKSQELRYDKLKNHALSQLEGANAKLEALTRNHALEMKKLTAQLKKEEVSRQSIMEQLSQKTKENEELVKICDELINNSPDGN